MVFILALIFVLIAVFAYVTIGVALREMEVKPESVRNKQPEFHCKYNDKLNVYLTYMNGDTIYYIYENLNDALAIHQYLKQRNVRSLPYFHIFRFDPDNITHKALREHTTNRTDQTGYLLESAYKKGIDFYPLRTIRQAKIRTLLDESFL